MPAVDVVSVWSVRHNPAGVALLPTSHAGRSEPSAGEGKVSRDAPRRHRGACNVFPVSKAVWSGPRTATLAPLDWSLPQLHMALPSTMRAVVYGPAASPMVMNASAPAPKGPGPQQVLVHVQACGINPIDYKLGTLPLVGWLMRGKGVAQDFAGVVHTVGKGVTGLAAGDRVFGNASASLAEYTVADVSAVAKLPEAVSFVDGASLPTAALTSLQALREAGGCTTGSNVLVIGASGGCGSLGIQIARACGAARVTGVCSAKNADAVRALGADVVADYSHGDLQLLSVLQTQAPFDVCYDTVTSPEDKDYTPIARQLLKRDTGKLVAINGPGGAWTRMFLSRFTGLNLQPSGYSLILKRSDGKQLAMIGQWVASGAVKTNVETTFPFTQEGVTQAYACLKSRRAKGKLVVSMEST